MGRPKQIPSDADLNNYKTTGIYHQSADAGAQSGSNYPTPHAGVLVVYSNSSFTFQQYQSYFDDTLWIRRWYDWGKTWSSWKLANINAVYPVGSIYMSVNSTNPGTLFGGTWQRIEGRFLLGASATYGAGSQGGEAAHTLTVNEMPTHTHPLKMYRSDAEASGFGAVANGGFVNRLMVQQNVENTTYINSNGHGWSHNNMPPYLAVYIWKRTA